MNQHTTTADVVDVLRPQAASPVILVCEHASHFIPAQLDELGLSEAARYSHVAWDPGAMGVARLMSRQLDAALVAAKVSRLVYDCNRPPEAPDAMPERSEAFEVPGNAGLTEIQREARVRRYYHPFHAALEQRIAQTPDPVIVTLHSFTPVYGGHRRQVEIGILHDVDSRLADAFLSSAAQHTRLRVERNAPYGPQDGVTHTLRRHALGPGHLNVMIELRNDLVQTDAEQHEMAQCLSAWTRDAIASARGASCRD